MNRRLYFVIAAVITSAGAHAAINVPGANGSDGALNVTANTVIDLSLAPTGTWDQDNTANTGKGVYDPLKWAVVFKYSSVSIAAGATVTFKNHGSHAPVVWLVNGEVAVSGVVNLNIQQYVSAAPPGSFRAMGDVGLQSLGPGGAMDVASTGGHATNGTGANPGRAYGNAQIIPLIGGSAGWGNSGGGAILIAATGTITVNGTIGANSGNNVAAGGAVRLVADQIGGSGSVDARGYVSAGQGRIRVESRLNIAPTLQISPPPSAGHPADPAVLWPADTAPSARIVSVGTEPFPSDPRASFGPSADVLPDILNTSLAVIIETKNVPTTVTVNLRVAPPTGNATLVPATLQSGNANLALWTAAITPPTGTTALQVRVEAP